MTKGTTSITITLPLPRRDLHPNARVHWAAKGRAVKAYRSLTYLYAKQHPRTRWHKATAHVRFYFKDRRRRDRDNFRAALKAAWDGIVDAGVLVDDDELVVMPPAMGLDRKNPRVEITIEPRT